MVESDLTKRSCASSTIGRVALCGHYAYYGIGGNIRTLQKVYRTVERYWRKLHSSRSRKGKVTWDAFQRIKAQWPLQRPRLARSYGNREKAFLTYYDRHQSLTPSTGWISL